MSWPDQCTACKWKPKNKFTAIAYDSKGVAVCLKCAELQAPTKADK